MPSWPIFQETLERHRCRYVLLFRLDRKGNLTREIERVGHPGRRVFRNSRCRDFSALRKDQILKVQNLHSIYWKLASGKNEHMSGLGNLSAAVLLRSREAGTLVRCQQGPGCLCDIDGSGTPALADGDRVLFFHNGCLPVIFDRSSAVSASFGA